MKDWDGWDTAGVGVIVALLILCGLAIDLSMQWSRDETILDGIRNLEKQQ